MYIATIHNNNTSIEIHGDNEKLTKGSIVKGINTIDSFSFSLLPSNAGFSKLFDYRTLVKVYNTNKNRYDFYGRVLYSDTSMSESGLITKDVICESYLGFLCDSQQPYVEERRWTVEGLFGYIIDTHNSQVEDHKRFKLGKIEVTDPNDLVYIGIQRANTWDTLNEKCIKKLGGEIAFRVEEDGIYIDWLIEIGEEKTTEIAVSKNMKSITQEKDPSEIITRLIPLGYKLRAQQTNEDGETEIVETEERLDITSVNGGKNYIDDEAAIALYGIRVGTVEFDDIEVASTLLVRGEEWLAENNKVRVKYTAGTLDLSLLGLDIDDFDVGNYYPIKNPLIDIDTTVRVVKKTIDVCEEIKSSLELGEKFESLSDIQLKYSDELKLIMSEYVTNKRFTDTINRTSTLIKQTEEEITLEVTALYTTFEGFQAETEAELSLKVGRDENDHVISMINAAADVITLKANRLIIDSSNFSLSADGTVSCRAGFIGNLQLSGGQLMAVEKDSSSPATRTTTVGANSISTHFKYDDNSQSRSVSLRDGAVNIVTDGVVMPVFTWFTFNGVEYALIIDMSELDSNPNRLPLIAYRFDDDSSNPDTDTTTYPWYEYVTITNDSEETVYIGQYTFEPTNTFTIPAVVHSSATAFNSVEYEISIAGINEVSIYVGNGTLLVYNVQDGNPVSGAVFTAGAHYYIRQGSSAFPIYTHATVVNESGSILTIGDYSIEGGTSVEIVSGYFSSKTEYYDESYYMSVSGIETIVVTCDGETLWTLADGERVTVAFEEGKTYVVKNSGTSDTTTYPYQKRAMFKNETDEDFIIGTYTIGAGESRSIPVITYNSETSSTPIYYDITAGFVGSSIYDSNGNVVYYLASEETITEANFDEGETYTIR